MTSSLDREFSGRQIKTACEACEHRAQAVCARHITYPAHSGPGATDHIGAGGVPLFAWDVAANNVISHAHYVLSHYVPALPAMRKRSLDLLNQGPRLPQQRSQLSPLLHGFARIAPMLERIF